MTQREERLADLHELEHPDDLQRVFAAVYLFSNVPARELALLTPKQFDAVITPIEVRRG